MPKDFGLPVFKQQFQSVFRNRKFGKKPARHDPRTLMLAKYLTPALTPPPDNVDYSKGFNINFGMMLNDNLGDCTIAACGHAIQTWTLDNGRMITVPDSSILTGYEQACGYDPSNPSTDQGGDELTVLNYFRQTGIGGHKIMAYADPNPGTILHVKQAITLFGGIYIGFSVPQSFMDQFDAGQPITPLADDGGIIGGHAIWICGYNGEYLIGDTWGSRVLISWSFWTDPRYVDESHALLSLDWLNNHQVDPQGVLLGELEQDLSLVVG
jgi:hypothetical protein